MTSGLHNREVLINQLFKKTWKCRLCHQISGTCIKSDPKKIKRKFFPAYLKSKIFIISQSLASNQVRLTGIPYHNSQGLMSKGGRFLEKYLNQIGYSLSPSQPQHQLVYTTDIIKCYPGKKISGSGDNIPGRAEIENCRQWLLSEMELFGCSVMILIGSVAIKTFWEYFLVKDYKKANDLYARRHTFKDKGVYALPHSSSMVPGLSDIYQATFSQIVREKNI